MLEWLDKFCNYRTRCSCYIDACCGFNWKECCDRHDKRYANTRLTRYQADILLLRCIKKKSNTIHALLVFIAVRIFGWIRYGTSY